MQSAEINPDLPIIRQTRFYLSRDRIYQFDVNQDITIHKLKKMIITAANLGKVGLRIFNNRIEYTNKDTFMLEELFPNQQLVEFTLEITYKNVDDLDHLIKLKFKDYCSAHKGKYPYFYCYQCAKSLCSNCLKSNEHKMHDVKEKYDYLQNSKNLIEEIFFDLNNILMGAKEVNENSIEQLKARITIELFPQLVKMVKQIEQNLLDLITNFTRKESVNLEKIRTNVTLLKNHCAEGLDKLKSEISIEDMMLEEEIFLTFDRKFKEIHNEKKKFQTDVDKFKEFCVSLSLITEVVDKVYFDVFEFLKKYINYKDFSDIHDKINNCNIDVVSRQKIIYQILSNIKRNPTKSKFLGKIMTEVVTSSFEDGEGNHKYFSPIDESIEHRGKYGDEAKIQYVGKIQVNTNNIFVFDSLANKVQQVTIDFTQLHGISNFLFNCAWCNYNNKLYFSGGLSNNVGSNTFLVYDLAKNSLKRLSNMFNGHYSHSMIVHENILYVIGGKSLQCEKFDLISNTWSEMNTLLCEQQYPILYPHQNYLYSFFGLDINGKYIDTIQKVNFRREHSKWEYVQYLRNNFSLEMYGCGIIRNKTRDDIIYFVGGKDASSIRKTTLEFSFKDYSFKTFLKNTDQEAYFKDSIIPELIDGTYGAFSLNDNKVFSLTFNLY